MAGPAGAHQFDDVSTERSDEMAELRHELALLRREIRGRLPKMMMVNVASMIGTAVLVHAASTVS